MRIQITEVTAEHSGVVAVGFQSVPGSARARWLGNNCAPVSGKSYDVELDVDALADANTNMRIVAEPDTGISSNGATVRLCAMIEDMDEDGMAYLRLSDDCLLMIEVAGEVAVGSAVEIRFPQEAVTVTVTGSL
jgi:hypothetical protein